MVNLPNFLGHGPRDTAYGNVLRHGDMAAKNAYALTHEQQAAEKDKLLNALQAIRNQYLPKQLQQEEMGRDFGNTIKGAEAQYAPQTQAANLERTLAEIEKMRREAKYGGNLTGELGNVAKVYALEEELGADNPLVQALKKNVERQQYAQDLRNKQVESINATRNFNQLPAAEKSLLLGKLRAAGIPDADVERIKNGEIGFNDYLLDQGMTPEQIEQIIPQQAPTTATQSVVQQVQGALAEDAYIGPKITEALGPYSEKIFGYSPEQVMQAFENNPSTLEQRAKALAARALVPEVAGYRTRIAGGSEAHKALSELTHNSLNRLKVFDALVTPKEYELAQKYIHEWQQGMGEARIRGLQGVAQKASLSDVLEKGKGPEQAHQFIVDGQIYEIPADKVEPFKKAFPGAKKR